MTTRTIGAGTVLSGRYRLDDLLSDADGACFWRATDTVLARNVAIHAVESTDPRAEHLLEAARRSALVSDPRLLRVLDCDERDGVAWVVNEWGEGISLDRMLDRGTLPPARAAWLTREVAETIAHGHARGVAHGRLNPEAVLVNDAGTVKIVGYVVDACLEPGRETDPLYGELDDREADVIDLAGILYAALTGRWPGVAPSRVPPAPREPRRPLRPRQVRAGVPRTLDALCDRVLNHEASQHAMPVETAHEIAAALADFVGDGNRAAPVDAAGMHSDPDPVVAPTLQVAHLGGLGGPDGLPDGDASPAEDHATPADHVAPATSGTPAAPTADEATRAVRVEDVERGAGLEDAEAAGAAGAGADAASADGRDHPGRSEDPEATQLSEAVDGSPDTEDVAIRREPLETPDALDSFAAPVQENPPPPPFEEVPERPLFASTERRVPAGAPPPPSWDDWSTGSRSESGEHSGSDSNGGATTGFWALDGAEEPPVVHTGREGRGWFRTAVAVALLLVLVVGGLVALNRLRAAGPAPTAQDGGDSTPATSTTGRAWKAVGARDFDPQGSPASENPETVRNTVDGDPATTWTTMTYRGNPALGGLKDGVGVIVDLGRDREVGAVDVRFVGSPTSFSVYAAPRGVNDFPDSLDQFDKVGQRADAGTRARVDLRSTTSTRYVLVWLTRLPAAAGGYRGEIAGITVRS